MSDKIIKREEEVGVPSVATPGVMRGIEGFDFSEDLIQPRLKINQALSPMVVDGLAKPGTLYNSITNFVYGTSVTLQPIRVLKSRIKWLSREEGGFDCRSKDGVHGDKYGLCVKCEYSKWINQEPPVCNPIIGFMGLIRDYDNPEVNNQIIVASFLRTSYREGQQLLSKIIYSQADVFFKKYKLSTKQVKNDKGVFFVLTSDGGVRVTPEEYEDGLAKYTIAKSLDIDVIEDDRTEAEVADITSADLKRAGIVEEDDNIEF